ncbi:MAG: hypothetical protein ACYCZR_13500, partial [Burkholderiales bacterium]
SFATNTAIFVANELAARQPKTLHPNGKYLPSSDRPMDRSHRLLCISKFGFSNQVLRASEPPKKWLQ